MTTHLYILDADGRPVPEPDVMKWAKWFEGANSTRRIALTEVGDKKVSTVFLGTDHQYGEGPPILWETMVFPDCEVMDRCSGSREQAEAMHCRMVDRVKADNNQTKET